MRHTRRSGRGSESDRPDERSEPPVDPELVGDDVERVLAALYGDEPDVGAGSHPRRDADGSRGRAGSAGATP